MKCCPNPACPHRRAQRGAAEFQDSVAVCSDCGADLVPESDLSTAEAIFRATPPVGPPLPASVRELRLPWNPRVDIWTGAALIVLSLVLGIAGLFMGRFVIVAFGPFAYGIYRLQRGLDTKPPPPEQPYR